MASSHHESLNRKERAAGNAERSEVPDEVLAMRWHLSAKRVHGPMKKQCGRCGQYYREEDRMKHVDCEPPFKFPPHSEARPPGGRNRKEATKVWVKKGGHGRPKKQKSEDPRTAADEMSVFAISAELVGGSRQEFQGLGVWSCPHNDPKRLREDVELLKSLVIKLRQRNVGNAPTVVSLRAQRKRTGERYLLDAAKLNAMLAASAKEG